MQGVYKAKHWLFYIPLLYTLQVITVLAAYINAGSKTEFTNDSLNSPKIRKLNIDTLIISQGLLIHEEKNKSSKKSCYCPLNASLVSVRRDLDRFGEEYARMLLIFSMVIMYSVSCPLITPFGESLDIWLSFTQLPSIW